MNEALNVKDMKLYAEADSIFADLAARGFPAGSALGVNVVSQIDQLHYHGAASVHQAIDALAITAQASVLEVGAGWGGPSRYIAATAGARVTALELQGQLEKQILSTSFWRGLHFSSVNRALLCESEFDVGDRDFKGKWPRSGLQKLKIFWPRRGGASRPARPRRLEAGAAELCPKTCAKLPFT